jgi:hypothetical protein
MCTSTHTNESSLIDIVALAHDSQHSLKGGSLTAHTAAGPL